ncbi:type III secretion protein [Palleronia sediminis]|uniref:Type III secretion protein n=1 Tax=Palleronia sediminis TaxID=2547833 RepID=A0A4R5ZVK5_9RHOB|nr:flagellar biosynthetic protein FliR [Palleronia sediminis]TDL74205.1 type III secretion protein [Palleronia sediminis]
MTGIADLIALVEAQSAGVLGTFLRVAALMALLPGFGERSIPVRVRLVLAIALTAVVAPAAANLYPVAPSGPGAALYLTETAAGLAMGAGLRILVHVLQIAATMAAQSVSLSQILGTQAADPQPAMGHVLVMGGLALAMTAGLHVKVVEFILRSYEILPAGRMPLASELAPWGIARVADSFGLAFVLAAPFVVTSLVYNLALGAINRAMPQLMVAFIGAPAITLGGLVLFAVTAPLLLSLWLAALDGFLANPAAPG